MSRSAFDLRPLRPENEAAIGRNAENRKDGLFPDVSCVLHQGPVQYRYCLKQFSLCQVTNSALGRLARRSGTKILPDALIIDVTA